MTIRGVEWRKRNECARQTKTVCGLDGRLKPTGAVVLVT